MGLGERQQESDVKALEEGILKPLTKDIEKAVFNPIQGNYQKLRSRTVPLLYVLIGGAISVTLIIILAALYGNSTAGNDKDLEYPIGVTDKPLMPTERLVKIYVQCEDGWIMYRGKCYFLSDKLDTWNKSQKFCESHNSSLAIIDKKVEYDFLNRIKGENNHWIGLNRAIDNSGWVWTDGTPYTEDLFEITRLSVDHGELECAYLNNGGVKSRSAKIIKRYICSKKLIWQA